MEKCLVSKVTIVKEDLPNNSRIHALGIQHLGLRLDWTFDTCLQIG